MDIQRTAQGPFTTQLPIMDMVFMAFLAVRLAMLVLLPHADHSLGLGALVVGPVAGSQFGGSLLASTWLVRCAAAVALRLMNGSHRFMRAVPANRRPPRPVPWPSSKT